MTLNKKNGARPLNWDSGAVSDFMVSSSCPWHRHKPEHVSVRGRDGWKKGRREGGRKILEVSVVSAPTGFVFLV